jgi:hypothetical protein
LQNKNFIRYYQKKAGGIISGFAITNLKIARSVWSFIGVKSFFDNKIELQQKQWLTAILIVVKRK